jgi:hypothetical protein
MNRAARLNTWDETKELGHGGDNGYWWVKTWLSRGYKKEIEDALSKRITIGTLCKCSMK